MKTGINDTLVSMLPQIVGFFTGFIGSMLMARILGPDGVGIYALVMSVPAALTNFSDMGIGATAIKFASRAHCDGNTNAQFKVLRWAFWLRLAFLFALSIAICVAANFLANRLWNKPNMASMVRVSVLGSIFGVLGSMPTIYFQSRRDFTRTSLARIIQLLASFAGIAILSLIKNGNPAHYIINSIIASGIASAILVLGVPRACFFPPSSEWNRGGLIGLFGMLLPPRTNYGDNEIDSTSSERFASYMLLASIAGTIMAQVDIWMISHFLSTAEAGIYSAAAKFTLPMLVVIGALNTVLWPRVATMKTRESVILMAKKLIPISFLLSLAFMGYSILLPNLIPLVFGVRFASGIGIGVLLCIRYSIAILFLPILQLGYALGMARWYWKINILQLAIVMLLNAILIPRMGSAAAAYALIAMELFGGILSIMLMFRIVGAKKDVPGDVGA